ncbi:uncharacterized protein C2orf42 homolog isoform X2 [Watersipora subatra]|uniref:uncharacterized protein C2orf42 homolog isoform X2 n=1 Tax=Watersipora subatra TaxID=2589382 RepID=UPI00355BCE57
MLSPAVVTGHKGQSPMGVESLTRKYLGDLGKPTQRGVRKCTKCGTRNGTRGLRCKNAHCDQVFKAGEKKKPVGPEAVKLITDPAIQVYSVRSKTADNRGFVQLPIVQDLDGNPAVVDVDIVCGAAKCYVDTCARSRNDGLDPCFHIQSSVEALDEATPLTFKNSILNSMSISSDMRQQIWTYATDKPGPLVQRVAKNIMAVKTSVSIRNPLGYLHFTFHPNKKDEKRFVCTCREAKVAKVSMSDIENGGECTYKIQRCVHFYACICVFASDEQLSKEFKYAIDADVSIDKAGPSGLDTVVLDPEDATIESVGESAIGVEDMVEAEDSELHVELDRESSPVEVIISTANAMEYTTYHPSSKHPFSSLTPLENKRFKSNPGVGTGKYQTFTQWLQMATERINLSIHYSLPGNPKPLIFHISHTFWDCLMDRISDCTNNKRLLPSQTCTVIRTHLPPLGTYTQFTWFLTELSHVRKVFDCPEVSLHVSKYYDKTSDGNYTLSATPRVQVDSSTLSQQVDEPRVVTAGHHEYKTFLRVGPQGNQGITPFIIDWTPDLYPISHTGELSLTFQYSHMIDGLAPAVDDNLVHHVIEGGTSKHHHNIIIDV